MSRTIAKEKQAAGIAWSGAWSGLAGGNEVLLESASNVGYCTGTFGNNIGSGKPLANGAGAGKTNLTTGVDFTYNYKLNAVGGSDVNIYDTSASGVFGANKYMRIVHNTKNITGVTGCNIQNIYAKQLSGSPSLWTVPPTTDAYIDPQTGSFSLPKPVYFSRCESAANTFTAPDIYNPSMGPYSYTYNVGYFAEAFDGTYAKFGNGYRAYSAADYPFGVAGRYLYPVNTTKNWNKGTISCWSFNRYDMPYGDSWGASRTYFVFGPSSTYVQRFQDYWNGHVIWLVINGTPIGSVASGNGVLYHFYIVWDSAKSLSGGKSVRVFVNGAEILSSTASLSDASAFNPYFQFEHAGDNWATMNTGMDNIKMFDHVVSEDPSWEYNAGAGREYALHYIYGSASGYIPQLTGTNNGVGYYYLSTSATPATSVGSGGDETETLKASTTTYASGSFGSGGMLCDSSLNALNTTDHYNYGKRIDASTVEDPTNGFGTTAGGIVDTAASGALAVGKYTRLVANGLNVKDSNYPTAGYGGLKVFASPIVGTDVRIWEPPNKDRMYVDPNTGNYLFPRPAYWSKQENLAGMITTPEIFSILLSSAFSSYVYGGSTGEDFPAGKFGNCYRFSGGAGYGGGGYVDWNAYRDIYPYGLNARDWSKGTISQWLYLSGSTPYDGHPDKNMTSTTRAYFLSTPASGKVSFYAEASYNLWAGWVVQNVFLNINNANVTSGAFTPSAWNHLYIAWDQAKGLSGGNSVIMYVNGAQVIASNATLPNIDSTTFLVKYQCDGWGNGYPDGVSVTWDMRADNLKIWNNVASDTAAWEYNGGTGLENNMHYIYGAGNNYKPNLAAASSGVGYYRAGASSRQCVITI